MFKLCSVVKNLAFFKLFFTCVSTLSQPNLKIRREKKKSLHFVGMLSILLCLCFLALKNKGLGGVRLGAYIYESSFIISFFLITLPKKREVEVLVIIIIQWKLVVTQKHKFPSFNSSVSHFCSCFMCLIRFPLASHGICMLIGLKLVTFSLDKIIRIMGFPLDSICS